MGRAPCCAKVGLHRGAWSDEEDKLLTNYIQTHGEGQWRSMPSKAGLLRCGKSCRLRWMNYLRPGIKRGNFTAEENDTIIRLHSIHGSRWSLIATELSGRTDNEIKNHWNSHLKQKVVDANDGKKGDVKEEKKKRKTNHKSKKTKTVEKPVEIAPDQPISTTISPLPSSQSESTSFDYGSMSGASSSSTIDQVDADLLMTDFSWPNWSPLFDIDGALSINSQDDISSFDMPFDGLDLLMMKHDESELLEKLYDECLQLIEDGDGHE